MNNERKERKNQNKHDGIDCSRGECRSSAAEDLALGEPGDGGTVDSAAVSAEHVGDLARTTDKLHGRDDGEALVARDPVCDGVVCSLNTPLGRSHGNVHREERTVLAAHHAARDDLRVPKVHNRVRAQHLRQHVVHAARAKHRLATDERLHFHALFHALQQFLFPSNVVQKREEKG